MMEKIIGKADEGGLGNYALYIQGEKYPRAVFLNKTETYAKDAAKILAATPVLHAIPNPNAKEEVIRAEIENFFYVKNLVVRKIHTTEEAHKLKQGILNNALSKNKKQPVQQMQQKPVQQQIQHQKQQVQQQKPAQVQPKQPQTHNPIQKLSTRDIVAQAIQRIQDMQRQMQKPLQKVIQQQKQQQQAQPQRPVQKPLQIQKVEARHPVLIKIQQKSMQQRQVQQRPVQKQIQHQKPQQKPVQQQIQHQRQQVQQQKPAQVQPKQPQQKTLPRNAVSIQDEIRKLIREELSKMKR